MKDAVSPLIDKVFRSMEGRDRDGAISAMAPDILVFDPHYPQPRMTGHEEVARGLDWGLSVMERFGFSTVHTFLSPDGLSGAVEIDTNHVLKGGRKLSFPQVFVIETRDGLISRLQAYEPYGPNGMGGFFLGLERAKRRLMGRG
jgi:ketosteroid isomerase-like protein